MRSKCLVCENKSYLTFKPPVAAIFSGYPLDGNISFNLCPSCHFGWNTSSATNEDYTKYYSNFNKHHIRDGVLKTIDADYFSSIFKKITSNVDLKDKNILDYGSGDKSFVEMAKKYGAGDCGCYDIGGDMPKSSAYDLVVCLHAMEHFYDFNLNMAEFKRSLRPDGMIYIAVPDMEGYKDNYYGPFNAIDFEHINHFSVDSLREMVLRHDYEILEIGRSVRQVSENVSYPEVWVLAKINGNGKEEKTYKDSNVINSVFEYLNQSIKDFDDVLNWFEEVKESALNSGKKNIILIGLGTPALRLLEAYKEDSSIIICDNDKRLSGRSINNRPVLNFNEVIEISPSIKNHYVVLAVNNFRIKEFLLSQGIECSSISMYE